MLDDLLSSLLSDPEALDKAYQQVRDHADKLKWFPNVGPQEDAYHSEADILLYGGQGGGGKSSLIIGLALTQHQRSLIIRRHGVDLGAIIEETIKFNGTRDGFNGSPPPRLRTADGRQIDFGSAERYEQWQGQPHDLLAIDEAAQAPEYQVRFLMGWVRTTAPGQRTRVVLATNPPLSAEGEWLVEMFRPWLDITHPNPARPGELRWFVTDPEGKDLEVAGPQPFNGLTPLSRTFIPASLADNPFLAYSDYRAKLDALPEPLRSAIRDGNFMATRQDDALQVIPTEWVRAAQQRWTEHPPEGVPMCAIGVDVAQGGADTTALAPRYDGWFAPIIEVPGAQTPTGAEVAGLIITHRRGGATVIVDAGGGYGGAAIEHLKANSIEPVVYKGANASSARTIDRTLTFFNKRAESWWRLREALDPGQEGGSGIALPPDQAMLADLTAPRLKNAEIGSRGIQIESKDDIKKRLGRSPNRGDAVVLSWSAGGKIATHYEQWKKPYMPPRVNLGREQQRRRG